MSAWSRLFYRLGFRDNPGPRYYEMDAGLHDALQQMAVREHRPVRELVSEVIASGLDQHKLKDAIFQCWQTLTPREQDVSALACLGYTNRQIGARLGVAAETVKTHLRHALSKFEVHGRSELSRLLSDWDFSFWEDRK
jgi:DNA-binding CsgD family transcriptional regulator